MTGLFTAVNSLGERLRAGDLQALVCVIAVAGYDPAGPWIVTGAVGRRVATVRNGAVKARGGSR